MLHSKMYVVFEKQVFVGWVIVAWFVVAIAHRTAESTVAM